ncbi:MAG: TolC family protein [Thermoanaerobaculia bacterium]
MPSKNPGVLPAVLLVLAAVATPTTLEARDETALFAGAERLERDALVDAVLERNPGLAEARAAWRAARERVPQARSLDDPMVGYSLGPLSIASDEVRFGQVLEARQRIPYPGKLRLREETARAAAEAAERSIETVRLELATEASLLFDEWYLVHRDLELTDEHVRLLEDFQRIATARYAAGEAPQQAPIQAEVELSHLVHRRMVLETEREILAARINALLHRDPAAPLPPAPPELPFFDPERDLATAGTGELPDLALASRPELARLDAESAAREAEIELRELDRYPDFEAMASYNSMWAQTEHQWMVGVGVNVPIRRERIRAAVAEARAEAERVESERLRLEDEVRAEVRIAWARLRESRHVLTIYESRVLPAARDQVRAALSGFETGRTTFLALIEAERNQRTAELEYHQTLAQLHQRRAALERALGTTPGPLSGPAPETPEAAGIPALRELQGEIR